MSIQNIYANARVLPFFDCVIVIVIAQIKEKFPVGEIDSSQVMRRLMFQVMTRKVKGFLLWNRESVWEELKLKLEEDGYILI